MKKGFTLVELLITMIATGIVATAAITFAFFGLRTTALATDAAQKDATSRIVTTMLQNLASGGTITGIDENDGDYSIKSGEDELLNYNSVTNTISVGNNAILENVTGFSARLDDDQLLTFKLIVNGQHYTNTTYLRTQRSISTDKDEAEKNEAIGEVKTDLDIYLEPASEEDDSEKEKQEKELRAKFMAILAAQLGVSGGKTYTDWYSNYTWPEDTAWCATFLSWSIDLLPDTFEKPRFANVGTGMQWFNDRNRFFNDNDHEPELGDFVFLHRPGESNPYHVGAFLTMDDKYIYTIEGNLDNEVKLRAYDKSSNPILGYGVVQWVTP